jgi:hypothetical protein
VKDIPARMRQTRMRTVRRESLAGLLCQAETTSVITRNYYAECFQNGEVNPNLYSNGSG